MRGLKCPLPVLKARRALRGIAVGDELAVLSTDAQAPDDFVHFCTTTGNRLIGAEPNPDHVRIRIQRLV